MGAKSGIKWNGVAQVQTQNTIETIGADVQIILRDPRTEQEWVTSSVDYINALTALGVITGGGGDSGWEITGNADTNPATNFIGTTDAQDFIFKTNNTETARITSDGFFGIGLSNPFARLQVQAIDNLETAFVVENIDEDQILAINAAGYSFFKGDLLIGGPTGIYSGNLVIGATNSTGNIGVRVDAPTQSIDIVGNIQLTGALITVPQYAAPLTGDTVTSDGNQQLVINPAGTLLALTVDFPATPVDGQRFDISCTQIITGLTLTAAATILGTLTTFAAANAFAGWVYSATAAAWVRQH